jgi:hypothetical protein
MARCEISPRKHVVGLTPTTSKSINWVTQPVLEADSSGLLAGYFPSTRWYMLQGLGYHDAPLYVGNRTSLRAKGYMSKVHVILYGKDPNDAICRIHYATALRATFDAGIRDVAHHALVVLRSELDRTLRSTQFAHLPWRSNGSLEVIVQPALSKDYTADHLREIVCLTTALANKMTMGMDEIEDLHLRNKGEG